MDKILNRFGFKKTIKFTIDAEKSKFVEFLQSKVKPNQLFFLDIFDFHQKDFYGYVDNNTFIIRRGERVLLPKSPFCRAEGKITSSLNKTELEIELVGWNWFVLLWFSILFLIFGINLIDIINTAAYEILIVFGSMFLILFLIGIWKIKNGVRNLESFLISNLNENVPQQRI